jgi:hypothetical protein
VEAALGFAGMLEAVLRFVGRGSRPFCLGSEAVSIFFGFVFAIALLRTLFLRLFIYLYLTALTLPILKWAYLVRFRELI